MKTEVTNWGKYPIKKAELIAPSSPSGFIIPSGSHPFIARGMGRCYGDSALSEGIVSTLNWNKLLHFSPESGLLICESGVTFEDIIQVFLPKGFFLPVTPGTKFITVGGAIASDIHGKNHHSEGTFSKHVEWLEILTPQGNRARCSRSENAELFNATCGGMGLTGIITQVAFRLKKVETAYIRQKTVKAKNLDHLLDLFEENKDYTYSVSWADCLSKGNKLGRGILYLGEHASLLELPEKLRRHPFKIHNPGKLSVPFDFPSFALNPLTVKAFNFLYYHKAPGRPFENVVHYDPYFYPLDAILHWNRIYGKRGFTQYQFVIPMEGGREGMKKILGEIADSGQGSFLAVLKVFGKEEARHLLFPSEGYTLALDFPVSEKVFRLLDRLDAMVTDLGGKIYLTKDVRLKSETFRNMYPVDEFKPFMDTRVFASEQSERLFT